MGGGEEGGEEEGGHVTARDRSRCNLCRTSTCCTRSCCRRRHRMCRWGSRSRSPHRENRLGPMAEAGPGEAAHRAAEATTAAARAAAPPATLLEGMLAWWRRAVRPAGVSGQLPRPAVAQIETCSKCWARGVGAAPPSPSPRRQLFPRTCARRDATGAKMCEKCQFIHSYSERVAVRNRWCHPQVRGTAGPWAPKNGLRRPNRRPKRVTQGMAESGVTWTLLPASYFRSLWPPDYGLGPCAPAQPCLEKKSSRVFGLGPISVSTQS